MGLPCWTGETSLTLSQVPTKLGMRGAVRGRGRSWSFLGVQKSFGKRIVLDLEGSDIFVLVGSDRDKLSGSEGKGPDLLLFTPPWSWYTDHVHPGLVLVQAVQHDLPDPLRLVRQLHLGERDRLALPVGSKVGAVRVHIHRVGRGRFGLAPRQPLPVHVLPPVRVDLHKLEEDRVH